MAVPSSPLLRAFGAHGVGGARRPVGASRFISCDCFLRSSIMIGDSTKMIVRRKEDAMIDDDVFLFEPNLRTRRSTCSSLI